MGSLYWIGPGDTPESFPNPNTALREPDGLLAAGGELCERRLLAAYRRGIFPWYEAGQPVLWWSPDPRAVLFPDELRISRSLRKTLKRKTFAVSLDRNFEAVLQGCAADRPEQSGTWITKAMAGAYTQLHRHGHAHSVETWQDGKLAGGLYGVSIGRVFFGESMFSVTPDASKVALVYLARQLARWRFPVIDCQIPSAHLTSLGSRNVARAEFLALLDKHCDTEFAPDGWRFDEDLCNVIPHLAPR